MMSLLKWEFFLVGKKVTKADWSLFQWGGDGVTLFGKPEVASYIGGETSPSGYFMRNVSVQRTFEPHTVDGQKVPPFCLPG